MKTKFFFAKVKSINPDERTLDAIASTSDFDRDGEVILPSAFVQSIGAFKDNPVILACHQHRLSSGSSPVIGSAIPESIEVTEKEVRFKMRFAVTPLGEEYWQLYHDKHMRAFSIGFIPLEYRDEKDEKAGWVRIFTKIELLEISAVPVPSNRRALARAKSGYLEEDNAKEVIAEAVKELRDEVEKIITKTIDDFAVRFDDQLDEIKTILADSDGFAKRLLLDKHSEPPAPAGDNIEHQLNRIQTAFKSTGGTNVT